MGDQTNNLVSHNFMVEKKEIPTKKYYPELNPRCSKDHKEGSMMYEATIPPRLDLPPRVIYRCTTNSSHTKTIPLIGDYNSYLNDRNNYLSPDILKRFPPREKKNYKLSMLYEFIILI